MPDGSLLHVAAIHQSCLSIQSLIAGKSRREIIADRATLREIGKCLRTIRKEARRIPEGFRAQHPDIGWSRFSALHIVFFHEYYGIDVDAVWVIFTKTIPALSEDMRKLLDNHNTVGEQLVAPNPQDCKE